MVQFPYFLSYIIIFQFSIVNSFFLDKFCLECYSLIK